MQYITLVKWSMSHPEPANKGPGLQTLIRLFPVVFSLITLSVLLLPASLQTGQWAFGVMRSLVIIDPVELPVLVAHAGGGSAAVLGALAEVIGRGEVWRLLTPVFLHFDLMHIAFNGAIVYVLGQRLELRLGSKWMLVFVLVTAITSNVIQLWWSQQSYFGGLSGVAFGLFGGLIVLGWLRPRDPVFALQKQFVGGFLFFLVLFSTGITEVFGLHIANAAHWGGLAAGLVLGLLMHGVVPRVST